MITSETIQSIACIVGPDNVLSDLYNLDRYSADALNPVSYTHLRAHETLRYLG